MRLEGELAALKSENETLDNCQRDLTDMVKKLEEQKLNLENELTQQIEEYRKIQNRVESSEQEFEQLSENLESAKAKSDMADNLEKLNHELKNNYKKLSDQLEK